MLKNRGAAWAGWLQERGKLKKRVVHKLRLIVREGTESLLFLHLLAPVSFDKPPQHVLLKMGQALQQQRWRALGQHRHHRGRWALQERCDALR